MSHRASILHSFAFSKRSIFVAALVSTVLLMLGYRTFLVPVFEPGSLYGLLPGDPMLYHQMAVELAHQVRVEGWSFWSLWPDGQAPAGVLSMIYLIVGQFPLAIIPIN